jgi:Rod binding domain-containing protein
MQLHGIQVRPARKHKGHAAAPHSKIKFFNAHHTAAGLKRATADERHAQLTDQTQKWVAQTFFGQMLKQMRDSPFKSKLFDGGRGGEMFQQMADQRTAESMARGTGHKLVDSIVDRIEHPETHGPARQPEPVPAMRAAAVSVARAVPRVTGHAVGSGRDWGRA